LGRLLPFLDPLFIALSNFLYDEAQRLPSESHRSFMEGAGRAENAADEVNQKVFAWLERRPPRPFFLFVHYFDAHDPYDPPASFAPAGHDPAVGFIRQNGLAERVHGDGKALDRSERERLVAAYDGEIAAVDHHLGILLDRLGVERALDNAVIGVVSDHGESFGEHGLLSHGHHLHDEQTRIVFLLVGRGVPAPSVVETTVSAVDVAPTLLDLAGLQPPAPVDGRSLKPLLEGSPSEARPVYAELSGGREAFPACRRCPGTAFSVEVDGLKMIREGSGPGVLFDLATDPEERVDLSRSRPLEADRLRRLLTEYVSGRPAGRMPDEGGP
jgi:arylsulfatase A-like enzyme